MCSFQKGRIGGRIKSRTKVIPKLRKANTNFCNLVFAIRWDAHNDNM